MLSDEAIEKAKASGALVAASRVVPWGVNRRTFLMCRPLFDAIEGGRSRTDALTIRRWAQLEADISYFIERGYVTHDLLKQLEPLKYEHWVLRSRRPRPSLRVLGRFAKPDVFVGTHVVPRGRLKGKWSPEWEHEKLVCEDHWRNAGLAEPSEEHDMRTTSQKTLVASRGSDHDPSLQGSRVRWAQS